MYEVTFLIKEYMKINSKDLKAILEENDKLKFEENIKIKKAKESDRKVYGKIDNKRYKHKF